MHTRQHEKRKRVRKGCSAPALARVLLCFLCLLCFPESLSATTIQGAVTDASGAPVAGTLILRLSQEGTVTDPALLLIQPPVQCVITSGAIAAGCTVRGNDTISPAGTFYKVRIITASGSVLLPARNYLITGATFDFGAATPLASATIAAQAYQIVQDEGAGLPQRQTVNFTGAGVACSDDTTNARTNCSITGGGGGAGSTHQIDGLNLTTQDPINLQDSSEINFTNPAAGNIQAALIDASIADSRLTSNYSGIGSCPASNFVTGLNDNATPTCAQPAFSNLSGSATDAQVPDTITLTSLTQITNRAITDTTGDLPASRVDDAAAPSTFALFSGAAGTAAFRAIAPGDLGSGFLDAVGDLGPGLCAAGQVLKKNAGNTAWECAADDTGAGGGYATIQEEGTALTQRNTLNLIGPAVTASDNATSTRSDVIIVASGVGACGANQFVTAANDGAAPTCAQPGFANLSGAATDAQVPDNISLATLDTTFELQDDLDNTKKLQLQLSALTTLTTRTWTAPDASGEVSLLGQTIATAELENAAVTDAKLASNYGGVGACAANQFQTGDNDNAAPTCTALADADIPAGIARDVEPPAAGDVSGSLSAGYTINAGAVASPELAAANKTFTQPVVLFDPGGLLDTDDIASVWRAPAAVTLTEVWCEVDAGTTTAINLQRDDGTPANILSADLTCSTTGALGTINALEDNLAAGERIDFVMVTAGAATRASVMLKYTVD